MITKKIIYPWLFSLIFLTFNTYAQVILFEKSNFEGRNRILNEGSYRFLTPMDFNDAVSSIKVPLGMYLTAFEHADEGGGYGISIDLMEDCRDLTVYNFNEKISYIVVSKLQQRAGFVWVRGSMKNGQYMPPHWERARAGGVSLNALTATVAPPIVSNIIKQQLLGTKVLVNKATYKVLDVKGGSKLAGGQIWTHNSNSTISQQFTFVANDYGGFDIKTKDNFFVSLKSDIILKAEGVAKQTANNVKILVQDVKYPDSRNCTLGLFNTDCPLQQSWNIMPVPNELNAYYIENQAIKQVLQSFSDQSAVNIGTANWANTDIQKWYIVDYTDLLASPTASQEDINEYTDIVQNQVGVAVLNGETTKPIYFHHNQSGETIYKYKKEILGGKDLDAWFPVEEFRKTICGKVAEYKFCTQDFWHDSPVNSDKDANLHIVPDPKFSHMLINPRMISYANGDYYQKRVAAYCLIHQNQTINCNTSEAVKKGAEAKARADADALLRDVKWSNIEVEFTPNYFPSGAPINPTLSFLETGVLKKLENTNEKVCAYGPWMWERILYSDWPIVGIFKDAHFNNEIHPANQIWFKSNGGLNLMALADQTGYFDKKGNGEVEASGLNQKMRFHVAFELPNAAAGILPTTLSTSGIVWDYSRNNTTPRGDIVRNEVIYNIKGLPKLKLLLIHNATFKTHNVFVEKMRLRSDGTLQGYMVVETVPITNRGGSIDVFVLKN